MGLPCEVVNYFFAFIYLRYSCFRFGLRFVVGGCRMEPNLILILAFKYHSSSTASTYSSHYLHSKYSWAAPLSTDYLFLLVIVSHHFCLSFCWFCVVGLLGLKCIGGRDHRKFDFARLGRALWSQHLFDLCRWRCHDSSNYQTPPTYYNSKSNLFPVN